MDIKKDYFLSEQESRLVGDPEIFYAKQRIINKIYVLFGELASRYSLQLGDINPSLPSEVISISPKIYRGENYHQLPYVMLDHPRFFKAGEVFAIRSFFWWGQHFSIHLLLGGRYKSNYEASIYAAASRGKLEDWYISVTEDPWHHHFEDDNYISVDRYDLKNLPPSANYLKLAKILPLNKWENAETFFIDAYAEIISVIQ